MNVVIFINLGRNLKKLSTLFLGSVYDFWELANNSTDPHLPGQNQSFPVIPVLNKFVHCSDYVSYQDSLPNYPQQARQHEAPVFSCHFYFR